jgi:hypothetical protein
MNYLNEVVILNESTAIKASREPKTIWTRENTSALVSERSVEDDEDKGDIWDLQYGQVTSNWQKIADAMRGLSSLSQKLHSPVPKFVVNVGI